MLNYLLFVSMISFQLSGAVILLINNDMFRFDEKTLIRSYYSKKYIIERKENGDYIIPAKVLQESFSMRKRNLWSVLLILCGYLIAAFSPQSGLKSIINLSLVITMTTVVILLVYKLTNTISKKHFPADLIKTEKEIDGIEISGSFTSFATKAEMEEILNS